MSTEKPMIHSLTGIRFYAALMVFVSHFYIYNYFFNVIEGPWHDFWFDWGSAAVSLFFVLSGFVMVVNYQAPHSKPLNPIRFYIARIARIYPVFILTACMAIPIELFSPEKRPILDPLLWDSVMLHCYQKSTCLALNGPGWSISSEFTFYLLFPLFAWCFREKPFRAMGGLLLLYGVYMSVMVWLLQDNFYATAAFPINRVAEFIVGMGIAHAYLKMPQWAEVFQSKQKANIAKIGILALWGVMLIKPWVIAPLPLLKQLFFLYHILPAAGMILTLAFLEKAGRAPRWLVHPWIILGGEISYSFYLLHHLVIRYGKHVGTFLFKMDLAWNHPYLSLLFAWGVLIVSLLSAYLLYRYYEMPCRSALVAWFKPKQHP